METLALILSIGVGVVVLIGTLAWYTMRNHNLKSTLADLDRRKEAAKILADAIKYLEPLGAGENLEWTNARCILEYAAHAVVFGDKVVY